MSCRAMHASLVLSSMHRSFFCGHFLVSRLFPRLLVGCILFSIIPALVGEAGTQMMMEKLAGVSAGTVWDR